MGNSTHDNNSMICNHRQLIMACQSTNNPGTFIIPSHIEPGNWIGCLQPDERVLIFATNFNDGRIFSLGRQLRIAGFSGNLIAAGDFLPDQINSLALCGFNHYLPLQNSDGDIDLTDLTALPEQGKPDNHSYHITRLRTTT